MSVTVAVQAGRRLALHQTQFLKINICSSRKSDRLAQHCQLFLCFLSCDYKLFVDHHNSHLVWQPDVLGAVLQPEQGGAPHSLAVARVVVAGGETVGCGLTAVLHPRPPLPAAQLSQARQIKLQTRPAQIKISYQGQRNQKKKLCNILVTLKLLHTKL